MVFANYFPLALKPNVRSWLMHLPEYSISTWAELCHEFVGAFTDGHQEPGRPSDLQLLRRRKERLCENTCRGSAEYTGIFQISTRQL